MLLKSDFGRKTPFFFFLFFLFHCFLLLLFLPKWDSFIVLRPCNPAVIYLYVKDHLVVSSRIQSVALENNNRRRFSTNLPRRAQVRHSGRYITIIFELRHCLLNRPKSKLNSFKRFSLNIYPFNL